MVKGGLQISIEQDQGSKKRNYRSETILCFHRQSSGGAFDIFLIYGYLGQDIKWMQKQELRKIPFVGKASEIAGHIFVDQSSLKSMIASIDKAKSELVDGASVTIFPPEGSRTKTGENGQL